MAGNPLTDGEAQQAVVLMAGVWAQLTKTKNVAPTAESAVAAMGSRGFDRGDGKMIKIDTPEIRSSLVGFLEHLAVGDKLVAEYMIVHPGAHTLRELAAVLDITQVCAEIALFGLLKDKLVQRLSDGVEHRRGADGKLIITSAPRYQIIAAEWLRRARDALAARDDAADS